MHCSGCGKGIPFGGQVCPYCHRDKSSDQAGTVAGVIAMLFGGWIGNLIGGFGGMIVGGVVLGMIAAIISVTKKGHSAKQPPKVRVQPAKTVAIKSGPKPIPSVSPSDRLRRLDTMKDEGLLSEDEYRSQRAVIIAGL